MLKCLIFKLHLYIACHEESNITKKTIFYGNYFTSLHDRSGITVGKANDTLQRQHTRTIRLDWLPLRVLRTDSLFMSLPVANGQHLEN